MAVLKNNKFKYIEFSILEIFNISDMLKLSSTSWTEADFYNRKLALRIKDKKLPLVLPEYTLHHSLNT